MRLLGDVDLEDTVVPLSRHVDDATMVQLMKATEEANSKQTHRDMKSVIVCTFSGVPRSQLLSSLPEALLERGCCVRACSCVRVGGVRSGASPTVAGGQRLVQTPCRRQLTHTRSPCLSAACCPRC